MKPLSYKQETEEHGKDLHPGGPHRVLLDFKTSNYSGVIENQDLGMGKRRHRCKIDKIKKKKTVVLIFIQKYKYKFMMHFVF